jgi:hypothetical protein
MTASTVTRLETKPPWPSLEARDQCIQRIAEEVINGDPWFTACCYWLVSALREDDELAAADTAVRFDRLVDAIRDMQVADSQRNGDSLHLAGVVIRRVADVLGAEAYVECTYCDEREARELAQQCDGVWFCSTECHSAFESPSMCPEDRL